MKTTVSLAQISIEPKEPTKNLVKTQNFVKAAKEQGSDLVVFPEMWLTGFDINYLHQHKASLPSLLHAIGELARHYSIGICGSLPVLDAEGGITNSSVLFDSEGQCIASYAKIHLFSPSVEEMQMQRGNQLITSDFAWGKSGFAICYDLRFPELFRSYALQGVKLVFLVAAFPHPRLEHWMTLIRARAIENQMYMVCVNRVGAETFQHAGSLTFFGSSMIVNPWGEVLTLGDCSQEMLLTQEISLTVVDTIRRDMQVLRDRQPHIYKLWDAYAR